MASCFKVALRRRFLGFLDDERRTNVLLTRSKRGLIVFGREKTLSLIPIWKEWFDWVNKNSLYDRRCNNLHTLLLKYFLETSPLQIWRMSSQPINMGIAAEVARMVTGVGQRISAEVSMCMAAGVTVVSLIIAENVLFIISNALPFLPLIVPKFVLCLSVLKIYLLPFKVSFYRLHLSLRLSKCVFFIAI